MPARNYRRFSLVLLAAGSLIASAGEVQRMEEVESTAREDQLVPSTTRITPAREPAPSSPIPAPCWKIRRARALCATGI